MQSHFSRVTCFTFTDGKLKKNMLQFYSIMRFKWPLISRRECFSGILSLKASQNTKWTY